MLQLSRALLRHGRKKDVCEKWSGFAALKTNTELFQNVKICATKCQMCAVSYFHRIKGCRMCILSLCDYTALTTKAWAGMGDGIISKHMWTFAQCTLCFKFLFILFLFLCLTF